ncbi:MAG: hypothetical protein H6741_21285 [Alphaproteobacteria bacterium]|nr:hypothetical protein [Alphaproteobacteria bacterium]
MTRSLIAALALAALSPFAWAGYANPVTTYVYVSSSGAGQAYGALRNVAYSSDSTSYVHCAVVESSTSADWMQCSVRSSQGSSASCYSTDPTVIEATRGVSDSSLVQFGFDSQAVCTYVRVQNDSALL